MATKKPTEFPSIVLLTRKNGRKGKIDFCTGPRDVEYVIDQCMHQYYCSREAVSFEAFIGNKPEPSLVLVHEGSGRLAPHPLLFSNGKVEARGFEYLRKDYTDTIKKMRGRMEALTEAALDKAYDLISIFG